MNSTNNPLAGLAPSNSHPLPYKKRACINCHDAKVRCIFLDSLTKCDRCLKQNRECVPHVSMQGKRPMGGTKKKEKRKPEGKVKGVAPSTAPSQSSAKPSIRVQDQVAAGYSESRSHAPVQSLNGRNIAGQPIFHTHASHQMQQNRGQPANDMNIIWSAADYNQDHTPIQAAFCSSAMNKSDQSSIKVNHKSDNTLQEKIGFDAVGPSVFKSEDCKKSSAYPSNQTWNTINVAALNCQQSDSAVAPAASMAHASQPVTALSLNQYRPKSIEDLDKKPSTSVFASSYSRNHTWNTSNVAALNCQQSDSVVASADSMAHVSQPVTAQYMSKSIEDLDKKPASSVFTSSHEILNQKLPSAQYKYKDSQSIDHGESDLPLILSLEQWVKHATRATCGENQNNRAYRSSDYLNASIKLAISLAENVDNTNIDLLPIGSSVDWISSTVVRLKPKARGIGDNDPQDKDDKLESFLEKFGIDETQVQECKSCQSLASPSDGSLASSWNDFGTSLDLNEGTESFSDTFHEKDGGCIQFGSGHDRSGEDLNERMESFFQEFDDQRKQATCSIVTDKDRKSQTSIAPLSQVQALSIHPDMHTLAVDSAELRCRENEKGCIGHKYAVNPSAQQIFQLATVFYFLFSGGELPPDKLKALASSPGAFVALPTLTLVETTCEEAQVKRSQGVTGSKNNASLCQVYCEYLCTVGLPGALCTLILNMLECVHGDLGGKETYSSVKDIISDLQLMLDKPAIFLFGPNMNELSMRGLQLNELMISRSEEFECIISCYNRCIEKSELAIIEGESGSGKSYLSRELSEYVESEGGVHLTAKFDQIRQLVPFQALASAFDQFLDILIKKESDWTKWVINRLQVALGRDACYLLPVIPKLIQVFDVDTSYIDSRLDQDPNNAMRRLQYLLCQFVDTVSASSKLPILLVCDDMQWADEASIALLYQMLRRKSLCILVCCRKSTRHEPIWQMINNATTAGINTTTIKLNCIGQDALKGYLSDLLCLSPRIIRPLSDIAYKRTKGNLLYLQQLLLSLSRKGLLRFDLRMKRWVWNESKIISTTLPDNVALCFTGAIGNLPVDVQLALHTLSMFGASVKIDFIKLLESKLNLNLQEPLKWAETEGLINHTNGYYTFCHDMIQETCQKMIAEHDRRSNHLIYGRCFISQYFDTGADDMLFAAVSQLNSGGVDAVSVPEDYILFATYSLMAAKKAMQMTDFSFAHSLLNHGILFLTSTNHWVTHYQLSLEMFELACKCAFAIGDLNSLRVRSELVFERASSIGDTLEVHFIVISSRLSSNLGEAMRKGLEILLQLGICVPNNVSQDELGNETEQTIRFALGITPELLLNYKIMTDAKMLMAQKFMSLLLLVTHHAKPELSHYLLLKMIQMVLSHGLSEHAPGAFSCFGSYLAMPKNGYPELGHRYANIAKTLLHKLNASHRCGEVMLIVAHMKSCLEPLGAAVELFIEGERGAISAGDVNRACFHRLACVAALFWSGAHLQNVHDKVSLACVFMKEQEHKNALIFMMITQRKVMALLGRESAAIAAGGLGIENSVRHFQKLHFQNMYLSLLFSESNLKECCMDFFKHETNSYAIVFSDIMRGFIAGLASFQLYRETKDSIWMSRGASKREDLLFWATKGCKWNFDHKLSLLLAEESFSLGDLDTARGLYTRAIAAADQSRFINDSALACELAARFYRETGDLNLSLEHFRMAHEKYKTWGALGKAYHLASLVSTIFGQGTL